MLADSDKHCLLQIARGAIEAATTGAEIRMPSSISPSLLQPAGAFVSLHESGDLRGCIGYVDAVKPLHETVRECATKAALADPRFAPVGAKEVSSLEIEISVLSPLRRIESIEEIVIGTHGLVAEAGQRRGLLLPQVAVNQEWDKATFLKHTLTKAGITSASSLSIFTFTAEVFNEHTVVPA